ncbi:DUF1016 N-terminal domain-containing protein [Burkholderia sp. Bp8991]|uniref:DUF1016 N-terminal domain-containing protein n=1 Tax=Burkholderia sp. Bp8991 TaxID=2184553 RepID=UPI0021AB8265|nr:DUF1016 N-terminal domain-containing protein [Burkholderia sp. Bp8991]
MTQRDVGQAAYAGLHREIADVVASAREATARTVNALMTATYWEIGRRIVEFEQGGEGRAAYGEAVICRLGVDLSERFGRGFGWRNLAQMRAFYLTWPADRILQTLSAQSTPARIVPTASAKSTKAAVKASPGVAFELNAIAQAFPLPWSIAILKRWSRCSMLACLPLTCRSNRTDAERFLPVAANTPAVDVHG